MTALPAHAPLAPSAAARWINCPGSIKSISDGQIPPPPVSPYAEEGTRAHALFAQALLEGKHATDLSDDPVLAAPLQDALEHARRIIAGRAVLIEQRLPPLPWLPDLWGTVDIAVFDRHQHVSDIIDLKFGAYIPVQANAPQTGIYGLLAAARFGLSADGLTTWIIQPRYAHPDGPVRSHHYAAPALRDFLNTVTEAAEQTKAPNALRSAGPWCRFCEAAATCPEQRELQLQSLSMFSKGADPNE